MADKYMAFMVSYGGKIINFIQVKNQFFVNYGEEITISPMTRIKKLDYNSKNNTAILKFTGLSIDRRYKDKYPGGTLELDLSYGKLMKEFVSRFLGEGKKHFLGISPIPVGYCPKIAIIKLTGIIKRQSNKFNELSISDNLNIGETGKKEYTDIKTGWIMKTILPITYYNIIEDKNKKRFREVVEEYAFSLGKI